MAARRCTGTWELDKDHRLVYRLSDGTVQTLDTQVIAADGSSLTFGVSSRDRQGNAHLRVLRLAGRWKADGKDRLTFLVRDDREKGVLEFRNAWRLDAQKRIVYSYERRPSGTRLSFRLEGSWQLDSESRIAYVLGAGSRRRLEFSCRLESLSLRRKQGTVKFRVGAGLAHSAAGCTVTLNGSWRLGRDLALDIETGLGGRVRLDAQLVKKFLKDRSAEAYLRVRREGNDRRIEAGARIPF